MNERLGIGDSLDNQLHEPMNIFSALSSLRFLAHALIDQTAADAARQAARERTEALLMRLQDCGVTLDCEPANEDHQLLFTFRNPAGLETPQTG